MRQWWHRVKRKSPLVRKSFSTLKQIPRFSVRLRYRGRPFYSLMANSFPKSGTHLLVQILEAFPGVRNYDSFIATIPSVRFVQRSERTLLRRISWIVPGELVSAHLHYTPVYAERLAEENCVVFFIYRDPRDVAVSEAHYLTYMNRWHRVHRYFAHRLDNDAERLRAAITGIPESVVPYRFPNIGERFAPFAGWLNREDVYAVKFEDLISENRRSVWREMADFFCRQTGQALDVEETLAAIEGNIDSRKSRTFRSGKSGSWREVFGPQHIEAMKSVAGDLLVRLGYEDDLDW